MPSGPGHFERERQLQQQHSIEHTKPYGMAGAQAQAQDRARVGQELAGRDIGKGTRLCCALADTLAVEVGRIFSLRQLLWLAYLLASRR